MTHTHIIYILFVSLDPSPFHSPQNGRSSIVFNSRQQMLSQGEKVFGTAHPETRIILTDPFMSLICRMYARNMMMWAICRTVKKRYTLCLTHRSKTHIIIHVLNLNPTPGPQFPVFPYGAQHVLGSFRVHDGPNEIGCGFLTFQQGELKKPYLLKFRIYQAFTGPAMLYQKCSRNIYLKETI